MFAALMGNFFDGPFLFQNWNWIRMSIGKNAMKQKVKLQYEYLHRDCNINTSYVSHKLTLLDKFLFYEYVKINKTF